MSFDRLVRATPARLDVGRAGSRPRTETVLAFRGAHAAARDAVWREWPDTFLAHLEALGFLLVCSAASGRERFVLNPNLGRRLAPGEAERIRVANPSAQTSQNAAVQLVLSDGLSAVAAERHCDTVVPRLLELLARLLDVRRPVAIRNGRVAIGDAVATASGASLVVHLIGERPGLSSADSLGCYLTYAPNAATTDADRKCISNIHAAGLTPAEAAATIAGVAQRILTARTSGSACVL